MQTTRLLPLLAAIALALPAHAATDPAAPVIVQPNTDEEYEAFRQTQDAAGGNALRARDFARARAIEEAVMQAARRFGDSAEVAKSVYDLGMVARAEGDAEAAERQLRDSLAMWKELDDGAGQAQALHALANVLDQDGRLGDSLQAQLDALELQLRHGTAIDQSQSCLLLARRFLELGDARIALHGIDRAIALMGPTPPDYPLGLNLALRSRAHRELGRAQAALADAQSARAAFMNSMNPRGEALGDMTYGSALAATGEAERGLVILNRIAAMAADAKDDGLLADALLAKGRVLAAEGRHAEAIEPLERAARHATAAWQRLQLREIQGQLQQVHAALGNGPQARAASERAQATQQAIDADFDARLPEMRKRFLALVPPAPPPLPAEPAPAETEAGGGHRGWWLAGAAALLALGFAARRMFAGKAAT